MRTELSLVQQELFELIKFCLPCELTWRWPTSAIRRSLSISLALICLCGLLCNSFVSWPEGKLERRDSLGAIATQRHLPVSLSKPITSGGVELCARVCVKWGRTRELNLTTRNEDTQLLPPVSSLRRLNSRSVFDVVLRLVSARTSCSG